MKSRRVLPFTRNVLNVAMMKCSTTRYSCVLQMRVLRCSIRVKGADTGSGRITERTFRVRKKKRRMELKRKEGGEQKKRWWRTKETTGGEQKKDDSHRLRMYINLLYIRHPNSNDRTLAPANIY